MWEHLHEGVHFEALRLTFMITEMREIQTQCVLTPMPKAAYVFLVHVVSHIVCVCVCARARAWYVYISCL
jgi:hypothetical protein